MSVNKVILLGRVGQDPSLKYTPSGSSVCSFSLATSEFSKDSAGSKKEKTEWHNIVAWGKLADLCNQYLSKGRQAFVEGRLSTRSWEDKDGKKNYKTEIIASSIQFIGGNGGNEDRTQPEQKEDESYEISSGANFTAEDIPFSPSELELI